MITARNYKEEIAKIGVDTLPPELRNGHDIFSKLSDNFSDLKSLEPENINKRLVIYLEKLNDWNQFEREQVKTPHLEEMPVRKDKEVHETKTTKTKNGHATVKEKKEHGIKTPKNTVDENSAAHAERIAQNMISDFVAQGDTIKDLKDVNVQTDQFQAYVNAGKIKVRFF